MFKVGNYFFESFDYLELCTIRLTLTDGSEKIEYSLKFFKGNNIFESDRFSSEKELVEWYNSQVDKEFQQNLLIKIPKLKPKPEEKLV